VLGNNEVNSIILPTVTLAVAMTSKYIRQVRAAVLDELEKDYVKGARSRGIREGVIIFSNVLRNAMLTIITLIGLSIGSLLGGTAIVETIFVWPGLGKLVIDAIALRDYPLIQGYVVWMAIIFVVINLLTDMSYRLLDPRIKLNREAA
jgi:peptide/nickel transport system permease protein